MLKIEHARQTCSINSKLQNYSIKNHSTCGDSKVGQPLGLNINLKGNLGSGVFCQESVGSANTFSIQLLKMFDLSLLMLGSVENEF